MTAKQAPRRFLPLARHHFVAGPYPVPDVEIGSTVVDKHHGRVVVAGFTQAPICWPGFDLKRCGLHRGLMPILFDGLIRAVVEEPEIDVAHYWGVTRGTVDTWRRIIAGCEDSDAVYIALAVLRADPDFRRRNGYTGSRRRNGHTS